MGSKYWHSHWEEIIADLQHEIGLGDRDYFSGKKAQERVKKNLKMDSKEQIEKQSCCKFLYAMYRSFLFCGLVISGCSLFITWATKLCA